MTNTPDPLNERDFELINIVGGALAANQRDLSRQMKLSLGMTNMLLRRLVTKGYIRISQLNKRKVQYLLTPKGFAEKMQKSVKYTLKTINSIGLIKKQLISILTPLYNEGVRVFYILGESDLASLIEMVARQGFKAPLTIIYIKKIQEAGLDGVVLISVEKVDIPEDGKWRTVNLIKELAKSERFI